MPRLFHLTSIYHLPTILESGFLKVVESNVSLVPSEEHVGPDVVWLTTSRRVGQHWAEMQPQFQHVDKCRVVIEVEVPEAETHRWWEWAADHGSSDRHRWALAVARGDVKEGPEAEALALQRAATEWFVVERPIPWQEWLAVTDQLSGQLIWERDQAQLDAGRLQITRTVRIKQSELARRQRRAEMRAHLDRAAPSLNIANDLFGGNLLGH
jgi:hypothetical protein